MVRLAPPTHPTLAIRASHLPMQEMLIIDYQIVGYFAVQHRYKSGIGKVVRFPKERIRFVSDLRNFMYLCES